MIIAIGLASIRRQMIAYSNDETDPLPQALDTR